jgi:ligand-binding sensor domain-containing protein
MQPGMHDKAIKTAILYPVTRKFNSFYYFYILLNFKKNIFFFLLSILVVNGLNAQFGRFRHITVEDGLSQSFVASFAQDSKGFIWICTPNGLNKYDGVKITTYKASLTDTNTIPHNNVRYVYIDKEDVLWGATGGGGIFKLDLKTQLIKRFSADSSKTNCLSNNSTSYITEYEPGKLYISTFDGLNVFDKKTETFTVYKKGGKNDVPFLSNNLRYTTVDKEGHFWFGHPNAGLTEYDPKTKKCNYYTAESTPALRSNTVRALFCDSKGLIWVSCWAFGTTVIDKAKHATYSVVNPAEHKIKDINSMALVSQFMEDRSDNIWFATAEHGVGYLDARNYAATIFENNKDDHETINDNTTFSVFQDRSGLIWCGTWKGGANILDPRALNFGYFKHESNNPNSLMNNSIFCFCPKSKNEIYVGTNMGACLFNRHTKTFTQIPVDEKNDASMRHNSIIVNIYIHSDGSVWLCSFGSGIYRYYPKENKYERYDYKAEDSTTLSFHTPVAIINDKKNRLWVGTEEGLNLYNPEKNNFTRLKSIRTNGKRADDIIASMVLRDDGKIWIGTIAKGLYIFDPETRTAEVYSSTIFPSDASMIALKQDSKKNLWIGTTGGLFSIEQKTGAATDYGKIGPAFSSIITAIEEDDAGNIWFANSYGLCSFNPSTKEYFLYNTSNGIQGKQFSYEASCSDSLGYFYFGGLNGVNAFKPQEITLNSTPPKVVLTDFTSLNKPYKLPLDVSYTDEITLSYKNYFFEFDFAALDYTDPAKNSYAYKLEGFNDNWVNIDNERKVAFTNLDPGTYTLLIKAANNDGFWGEPTKVKLIITPPFWRTTWFYLLCIVTVVLLIYAYIKRREKKLLEEKTILENKVKERTAELEIEKQKVEEAHKDIKDSINYAKRIQQAQMPTDKYIEKKLKDLKK